MSEDVIVFTRDNSFRLDTSEAPLNKETDGIISDSEGHSYQLRLFTYNDATRGILSDYWYAALTPEQVDAGDLMMAIRELKPRPASVRKL